MGKFRTLQNSKELRRASPLCCFSRDRTPPREELKGESRAKCSSLTWREIVQGDPARPIVDLIPNRLNLLAQLRLQLCRAISEMEIHIKFRQMNSFSVSGRPSWTERFTEVAKELDNERGECKKRENKHKKMEITFEVCV